MLDTILICIMANSTFYGRIQGAVKTLTNLSAIIGLFIGIIILLPGFENLLTKVHYGEFIFQWLQNYLSPIMPALAPFEKYINTLGMHQEFELKVRYLYIRALILISLIVIIMGIMMILNSYQVINRSNTQQSENKYVGIITGMITGIYIDGLIIKLLTVILWTSHSPLIGYTLRNSLIVNSWFLLYTHIKF